MKTLIVGLGVQGKKRKKSAGKDFVASVDPFNVESNYRRIEDVPINLYDSALLCVPDDSKIQIIDFLIKHEKNILVEKPLFAKNNSYLLKIKQKIYNKSLVIYTAYNHRFEPHFINMKNLINSEKLGKIYRCRMFYGNGTAQLVKNSKWRDKGSGVIHDLCSHLLDTMIFWFDDITNLEIVYYNNFENFAPDNAILHIKHRDIFIDLEVSILSWRNSFSCDIFAKNGSAHIDSLCKWGPTTFTIRNRKFPSGRPTEKKNILVQEDPTWDEEYKFFKKKCKLKNYNTIDKDIKINKLLNNLKLKNNG